MKVIKSSEEYTPQTPLMGAAMTTDACALSELVYPPEDPLTVVLFHGLKLNILSHLPKKMHWYDQH